MNPTVIGLVVFTCTLGGALLGMWLRKALPEHHLNGESRDTVKVGVGLIATMTALYSLAMGPRPARFVRA